MAIFVRLFGKMYVKPKNIMQSYDSKVIEREKYYLEKRNLQETIRILVYLGR
jgi:hypothetical protein